jgi:MarR family transcriptional regulator, lower aerobic nicotinate degradation pathway regulator
MRATKPSRALPKSAQPVSAAGWGVLIFRLARMTGHRLGEALTELDMRTHEFAVLHHLGQAGPLSQQDLGAALRINPSNLVGLLDALEADGLVRRPRDPADRRRHLVELTAAGHQRLARAKLAAVAAEQELLAPLSERERKAFQGMLERLASHACARPSGRGRAC